MSLRGNKVALIGDLHGKWNDLDTAYFDRAGYDLIIFVGDLGSGTLKNEVAVIREIARLRVPGLVLPGNNDAEFLGPLSAELAHQSGARDLLQLTGSGPATVIEPCGFSSHLLVTDEGLLTLIAGRPCAMGGSELSFAGELERNFGVSSLAHSAGRLKRLVDDASTEAVVFLAHNGPLGLGGQDADPWARDFAIAGEDEQQAPRDWGDADLAEAIEYAKARGKQVLAVIAGHMHRRAKGRRPLCVEKDGTLYVNPAMVPRIVETDTGELHHFVELRLAPAAPSGQARVAVEERWLELPGVSEPVQA